MNQPSKFFEVSCADPKGLLERAHIANQTKPSWRSGFTGESGLLAIIAIGLMLASNWFFPWNDQVNLYALIGGFGMLIGALMMRGRMVELQLWGVVVDGTLRLLDGSYWMQSRATDSAKILATWAEHFPGSQVSLVELGYHYTYVPKSDLDLIALQNVR